MNDKTPAPVLVRLDDVVKALENQYACEDAFSSPSEAKAVRACVDIVKSLQPVETLDDVLASLPKNYRYVWEMKGGLFEIWTMFPKDELILWFGKTPLEAALALRGKLNSK